MSSLDDLSYLQNQVVTTVKNAYSAAGNLNFYNSHGVWKYLIGDIDDRLQKNYSLVPKDGNIPETPRSTLIVAFRSLYRHVMENRPATFEECMTTLEDMRVTLATMQELHDFSPYSDIDPTDASPYLADKIQIRQMSYSDLFSSPYSVVSLETDAMNEWNSRHVRMPLDPWDDKPFSSLISDEPLAIGRVKMKSVCTNGGYLVGSFGLRKPEKSEGEGLLLVSYGSMTNSPGLAVRTVRNIIGNLQGEPRKRLQSVIVPNRASTKKP